jgi:hypothetical protein
MRSCPEGLHGGDEEPDPDEEYGRGAHAARVARQKEYETEQQQDGRDRAQHSRGSMCHPSPLSRFEPVYARGGARVGSVANRGVVETEKGPRPPGVRRRGPVSGEL